MLVKRIEGAWRCGPWMSNACQHRLDDVLTQHPITAHRLDTGRVRFITPRVISAVNQILAAQLVLRSLPAKRRAPRMVGSPLKFTLVQEADMGNLHGIRKADQHGAHPFQHHRQLFQHLAAAQILVVILDSSVERTRWHVWARSTEESRIMGIRQFLLRGLEKVKGEWTLACLAWNLKRMAVLPLKPVQSA